MADKKLIAVLQGGRAFALVLPQAQTPEQALAELTGHPAGGGQPDPFWRPDWLETEERFHIRKDAVVAYVVGRKEGEWAVAE